MAAYYLISESLANIGKYARASSATVEVARGNGHIRVEVVDDGIGGADTEERLRSPRPRRPRGGARRPASGLESAWRRHACKGGDSVRVVIAEDGVLLREGLAQLLAARGFDVVGSCDNAERLLLLVRSYSPDVAIVDIRLPPTHSDEGLRAALQIRSEFRRSVSSCSRSTSSSGSR